MRTEPLPAASETCERVRQPLEVAGGELVLDLPSGGGLRVVARFPPAPAEEPELQQGGLTATAPP